jgi:hypothetical protein
MNDAGRSRRFDDAWQEALTIAGDVTMEGLDVFLVRDLLGRATLIIIDHEDRPYPTDTRTQLEDRLRVRCAPFVADLPVLAATEMFAPDSIISASDLIVIRDADPEAGRGRLGVLEQGVIGREWRQVKRDPQ